MNRGIPREVLALLESGPWQHRPGLTRETVADCVRSGFRLRQCCYGVFAWGENQHIPLTREEVLRCASVGAFGRGVGAPNESGSFSLNEHALHSLMEFLGECSHAWGEHRERLRRYVPGTPNE